MMTDNIYMYDNVPCDSYYDKMLFLIVYIFFLQIFNLLLETQVLAILLGRVTTCWVLLTQV